LERLPGYRSLKTELMQERNRERQSGEEREREMPCFVFGNVPKNTGD
jgi:hypothetical protein